MVRFRVNTGAALVTALMASNALAQEMPAPEQEQATGEEILVTAQRRAQNLQDVPISITAVTTEELKASGVTSTQDLPVLSPGLIMGNVRNTTNPYLRGIGTQSGTAGTEGAVAVYVDGVYLPNAVSTVFSLNSVERIEIIKGPQGTLFGRNATGGAIQVVTRDPSYDTHVDASVGYGNYDIVDGALYMTGALSANIAADFALYATYQGEGWGKNHHLGNDVNIRREGMGRAKLKFDLSDSTSLLLSGDYARFRSDIGASRQPAPGTVAIGGIRPIGDIYNSISALPFIDKDSWQFGTSAVLRHELAGTMDLTSTTAYRKHRVHSYQDTDATAAVLNDSWFPEVGSSFQQELLLNGDAGDLHWTAGLFYFSSEAGFDGVWVRSSPGSLFNATRYTNLETKSYAGFGQGTYDLTDDTRVTLGARYTYDKKTASGRYIADPGNPHPIGTVFFDTANLPPGQTKRAADAVTWRIALDHDITENVLVYASANRGFKSGGYNGFDPAQLPVDPERLDAFEVGFKSTLFDRTLRLNASAFYYDYSDIQLQSVLAIGSVNFNAGKAEVKGFEGEFAWSPRLGEGELEISGSVSVLDAEYTEFPGAPHTTPRNPTVPPFGGNVNFTGSAAGNDMIRAPKFSSMLGARYVHPISTTFKAGLSIVWQHTGKFYWDPDNRVSQPAYDILNGEFTVGPADESWKARFWVRNLLDERYFVTMNATAFSDGMAPAAPRTYGVRLDFSF